MHITLQKQSDTQATILIQVDEADCQAQVDKKLKEYSKKVDIKGFRKGSVPPAVVKRMYGPSILMEATEAIAAQALRQYLKEIDLPTIGPPIYRPEDTINDWEAHNSFIFCYEIGIVPPYTFTLSEDLKAKKYQITTIDDQRIDDVLEELRIEKNIIENADISQDEDLLNGELRYPAKNIAINTSIYIDELDTPQRPQFIGLKLQQTVTFDVTPFLESDPELPGVQQETYDDMRENGGKAEFTVHEIQRTAPLTLDQDLFDEVLGENEATTEEEFRTKLRESLIADAQHKADRYHHYTISRTLLQHANIALPEATLRRMYEITASKDESDLSLETIDEDLPNLLEQTRWMLLTQKLYEDHHITATDEEVAAELKRNFKAAIAKVYGKEPPRTDELAEDYIQRFMEEEEEKAHDQIDKIRNGIKMQKLTNLIKDTITIEVQEISYEDFRTLMWKEGYA